MNSKINHVGTCRLVQVLVRTLERSGVDERLQYLKEVFYPMPVVCLFANTLPDWPLFNTESWTSRAWKDHEMHSRATHPAGFI